MTGIPHLRDAMRNDLLSAKIRILRNRLENARLFRHRVGLLKPVNGDLWAKDTRFCCQYFSLCLVIKLAQRGNLKNSARSWVYLEKCHCQNSARQWTAYFIKPKLWLLYENKQGIDIGLFVKWSYVNRASAKWGSPVNNRLSSMNIIAGGNFLLSLTLRMWCIN